MKNQITMLENAIKVDLSTLTKDELNVLVGQLEDGMRSVIASGDKVKIEKLNLLIGRVIDLYTSK